MGGAYQGPARPCAATSGHWRRPAVDRAEQVRAERPVEDRGHVVGVLVHEGPADDRVADLPVAEEPREVHDAGARVAAAAGGHGGRVWIERAPARDGAGAVGALAAVHEALHARRGP